MMEWTDRHCRYFLRLMSRHARLYTEMLPTPAILLGKRDRLLRFDPAEHPIALQLGGSNPDDLARCAEIGQQYGYDEINLNCGCPSDRVQEASFGVCLMLDPERVARSVAAMRRATSLPVTIKNRIGVDDSEDYTFLRHFVETVAAAGCNTFIIHARKAWLKGLSCKENRDIPPLQYEQVLRLKQEFPQLTIVLNGGIRTLADSQQHLEHVDGVMLGREAYENPYCLAEVDRLLFGDARPAPDRAAVLEQLLPYVERELANGAALHHISRHILGLYKGQPNGRAYRRLLSEQSCDDDAGIDTIYAALEVVDPSGALLAA